MLSEEEKKAIQMIKNQKEEVDEALIAMEIPENYIGEDVEQEYLEWQKNAETLLNLIEKQQAELEELKAIELKAKGGAIKVTLEGLLYLQAELEKKDKIIYEIAKAFKQDDIRSVEEIIEYFTNKVDNT